MSFPLRAGALAALAAFALSFGGLEARAQESASTAVSDPATLLSRMNAGLNAFLDKEYAEAIKAFDQVLQANPSNIPAFYYRGLSRLGLGVSRYRDAKGLQRSIAGMQPGPELDARLTELATYRAEALEAFESARFDFGEVARSGDPTARSLEAALYLGIAQLGSDDPAKGDARAMELAEAARSALTEYVSSDTGKFDRFGWFYLAVAEYRIIDLKKKNKDTGGLSDAIDTARRALENARTSVDTDAQANRVSAEQQKDFQTLCTYYEGLIAVMKGDNAAAKNAMATVAGAGAGTVSNNANDILADLQKYESEDRPRMQLPGEIELEGTFTIGNWYDTNVILLGDRTQLPHGIHKQDDYRVGTSFDLGLSRYFGKNDYSWVPGESMTFGLGAYTEHAWHPSIGEFDVNIYAPRAFFNWQPIKDLYLGVQYDYSYAFLGHESFISSNRITPVLTKFWRDDETERARTDVYYTYEIRDYEDEFADFRLNRDGEYHVVGARQSFNVIRGGDLWGAMMPQDEPQTLKDRWLMPYVGYAYRNERTIGTEFDLHGHSVQAGVDVPLPWRLGFEFRAEFTWDDYTDPSIFDFDRKERRDFIQRYGFAFTHTFVARGEVQSLTTLEAKLRAGVDLTFEDSNVWDRLHQQIYEYDRAVYGLTLQIGF